MTASRRVSAPVQVAVIGTGRAGQARIRALQTCARAKLLRADSIRSRATPGAISDPDVEAVIVCTDNASHFELARAALRHGKHVAVEFPLCLRASEVMELSRLSREHGVVLHVEVLTLLSSGWAPWREATRAMLDTGAAHVQSRFTGGIYRWVAHEVANGRLGQLALGRLHVLWETFGPLRCDAVTVRQDLNAYELTALLSNERCQVQLHEARAERLDRSWRLDASVGDRQVALSRASRGEQLFARDLDAFLDQVLDGKPPYLPMARVIETTRLAEQISAAARRYRDG